MRTASAVCAACVLLAAGCKGPQPTGLEFGQACSESSQCESGLCLFEGPEDEEGVCAKPCEDGSDCPDGWSCTGLTQKGELVCQEGPATPFGF